MTTIKAIGKLGDNAIEAEVLNPGDWFGKTWLIEIGGSNWPLFLAVEADSVSDALDELADNEKYGHNIVVADADLGDYPEEDRHYGPSGQVVDLDNVMVHGQERSATPWECVYTGDDLETPMKPTDYCNREDEDNNE
jgi:hypothetical protein